MKKLLLVLVLVGLALAGGAYLYRHPTFWQSFMTPAEPPKLEASAVLRGDLLDTVTANGVVQPQETLLISTDQTGRVVKLLHDVNDVVQEDDELLQLDDQVQQLKLKQAQAAIATAEAAVRSADASADEAKSKRDSIQVQLDRARETLAKGSGSQRLVDAGEAELKVTEKGIRTAEAMADTARAKLDEAKQQYDLAKLAVDLTHVRVPVVEHALPPGSTADPKDVGRILAGNEPGRPKQKYTILERKVVLNQLVGPPVSGQLFVLTPNAKQVELNAQVAESDVNRVAKGMPVYFTVSAYEDYYFTGTVKEVRPMPAVLNGTTYYNVVVAVDDEPQQHGQRLQPGMTTASLDVVCRRLSGEGNKGVWLVPESAVNFSLDREYRTPEDKDRPPAADADQKWVWVKDKDSTANSARYVPIKTGVTGKVLDDSGKGLRAETYTEVKQWGDEVKLPAEPGQQVPFDVVTGAEPGKKSNFKIPSLIKS